jgi:RNA polymerase II-associated factor 1
LKINLEYSIRFVRYKPTSLEKNYRWDLLTEHDVGVEIDLINPDAYTNNGRDIILFRI